MMDHSKECKLCSENEIDCFVSSLNTGDIIFFTTELFHSLISFGIRVACNSKWTHTGMIVKPPKNVDALLWESVNNRVPTSIFQDERFSDHRKATGSGVRLINFRKYLQYAYLHLDERPSSEPFLFFGVLRLNEKVPLTKKLQLRIENYVLNESPRVHMNYPQSMVPLIEAWWDGWESLCVPFGCFSTYQVELDNITKSETTTTHIHYTHPSEIIGNVEDIFCSQLVVKTLEMTGYFKSDIPCSEWVVDDLTLGNNINEWFFPKGTIAYLPHIEVRLICKT